MKKLYEKNELTFALVWIGAYVLLFSLADGLSEHFGIAKVVTAPLCAAMTAFLLIWLRRNGLMEAYGLTKGKGSAGKYLYYLPLVLIASTNLWGGIRLNLSWPETVLYVISIIGVGFLEEVIFRGFLFKALCREDLKQAVVISSVTFGFGHIVNLLNGAEVLPTLLQICYATAIGFLFTVIFLKSGSLIPCIVTHSVVNSLSAFAVEGSEVLDLVTALVLMAVPTAYGLWILKKKEE